MTTAWRIYKKRLARTAFSGLGARLYGGRWNSLGTAVVYLSQSQSLAALEILVHLEAADALKHYRACPVTFDGALVTAIDPATLPRTWRKDPPPRALQKLGDAWVAAGRNVQIKMRIVPKNENRSGRIGGAWPLPRLFSAPAPVGACRSG